jgi:carboxyl-terminal processing protease
VKTYRAREKEANQSIMKRFDSSTISIIICIVIIAVLSASLMFVINERNAEQSVDVTALKELAEVIQSEFYFYEENELDSEALVDGAMRGMIGALDDPYAQYFTEEEYNDLLTTNSGDYVGIGISVQTPDEFGSSVISVYSGGPADLAGIQAGDVLTNVNGTDVANLSMNDFLACFSTDDEVADEITYLRDGIESTVSVLRAEVHVNRVTTTVYNHTIGYIHITEFNGSVADDFWSAATGLQDDGIQNLIIDLRDNPGGGLSEVLAVADHFVPEGETIVTIKAKSGSERVYTSEGDEQLDMNIVVLVNGNSASASELLTGALKDYGLATIVGTQTYGKGIVQSFFRISENGGWAKMTTDAYYTPGDVCIQGVGITPDIIVELPEELQDMTIELLDPEEDTQLQAAIAVFSQKTKTNDTAYR